MAYATVVSVLGKVESFMYSFQSKNLINEEDMESLYLEISYLEFFLKKLTPFQCSKLGLDAFEEQIQYLVEKLEDLIESHLLLSDQSISESDSSHGDDESNRSSAMAIELLKVKQEISSFTQMVRTRRDQPSSHFGADDAVSSRIYHSKKEIKLVGVDDELRLLKGRLLSRLDGLQVVSVFGMAGIGKTTLTQQVYSHPSILSHFETRIMVSVGPYYNFRQLMLLVLDHVGLLLIDQMDKDLSDAELGMHLLNFLKGKRYLIVLDDVWTSLVWTNLKQFIPSDGNGSRIIMTTRLMAVAHHATTQKLFPKRFLSDEDSWNLLRAVVFTDPEEQCSFQLEKIGKKIAENCEGLPLAIVSVGKLLSEAETTIEYWKQVSEDENPLNIGVDDSTPISKSISLSYNMLHFDAKVCFLHVGVFPKDYEISVAKLIKLWVAEGFFRPQDGKTLEDIADRRFLELVMESVILFQKGSLGVGKMKTCKIHCVFRNLCISEARKQKFCLVMNKYAYSFPLGTNQQRRLCVHNNVVLGIKEVHDTMESIPSVLSLLCYGPQHRHLLRMYLSFELLRVLDALRIRFYEFPDQITTLARLRYLAMTSDGRIPKSISKLQNLEVLLVERYHNIKSSSAPAYLPEEIWSLKLLRHLQCTGTDLPDTCTGVDECDDHCPLLERLQTLSGVSARSCTPRILARMPNLKKLGVCIELEQGEVENFNWFGDVAKQLQCLESFKCAVRGLNAQPVYAIPAFPNSLKKLTLRGCGFLWKDLSCMGEMPNLETLKLQWCAFRGPKWETCEGQFPQLKVLLLEDLDIQEWSAKRVSFPSLTYLRINHCYRLLEIPTDIAYIPKLGSIVVLYCSPSLSISAKKLRESQQELGKDYPNVHVNDSWYER